jgi:hypothetical protein
MNTFHLNLQNHAVLQNDAVNEEKSEFYGYDENLRCGLVADSRPAE